MIEIIRRHLPQGLIGAVLTVSVVGTGVLGGVVAAYVRDLPPLDILEDYEPSLITTLYDDQGRPFAPFYEHRRILVPLADIPQIRKNALPAVEARGLQEPLGLDPIA